MRPRRALAIHLLAATLGLAPTVAAQGAPSLRERAEDAARLIRQGRADEALASLDALIGEARGAGDHDLLVQLRSDRIVALGDRGRWEEALEQLAELRAEGAPIRPYVRQAEAAALLALRRPEDARAIYAELVERDPGNREARLGRFYAEIECEDFAAAFRTADQIGDPVLSAQARHFAGLQAEAWAMIAPLARSGDAPAYVRSAAAGIESGRGWQRKAHESLRDAAAQDPDDVGIAIALAQSHLRRRDLDEARALEARLRAAHPDQPSLLRLSRELRDFDRASWALDVRSRIESGDSAAAPGNGLDVSWRIHSAPIRDVIRVFAGGGYATAQPPEGGVVRNRVGAGVEWRGPDASMAVSGWSNGGASSRAGAAVSAEWSPDDHWGLSADYERYTWDTPLRAVLHGITADGGGIGVGHAWNESRAASMGYRAYEFTDGNRRRQYRFAWAERVLEQPLWSVTLRPEIYGSRNSIAGAPYFNPSRDSSVSLAMDTQALVWRRYEASFRHRVIARAGIYRQEGFASGWVGGVAYEQSWQPHSRFEVRWGVELGRPRYDGVGENTAILYLSGSGRF